MDELDDALETTRRELHAARAALAEAKRHQHHPVEETRRALAALDAESERLEQQADALEEKVAALRQQAHGLRAELARLKYGAS